MTGPGNGAGRENVAGGPTAPENGRDSEPTEQVPRVDEPLADAGATQPLPRVDEPAKPRRGRYAAESAEDSGHETRQMPRVEAPPAGGAPFRAEAQQRRPRRNRALWIALVLVVLVVAGVFGWRYVQGQRFEERLATDNTAARQVVEDYYAALAAGDAQAALAAAGRQPEEDSLLTDEMLGSVRQSGGIADLVVGEADLATDPTRRMVGDSGTVAVSYRVGDTPVEVDLPVNRDAAGWRVASATSRVDLGAEGRRVNDRPAASQVVELFPGSYTVTTASPYVRLDQPGLVITVPDALGGQGQEWAGGQASLTPEGRDAVLAAARESLSACLAQKSLTPEGCPIAIDPGSEITIKADTIQYTVLGDPWPEAQVALENDTRARGTIQLAYRINAAAVSKGVEGVVQQSYEQETTFVADLTGEKPTISWQ